MTERCFLDWCNNTPNDNIFLLSFPKNPEKLANWCRILNININDIQKYEKAKICSCHFKPDKMKVTIPETSSLQSQNNEQIFTSTENQNYSNLTNLEREGGGGGGGENILFESLQIELVKNHTNETADPLKIPSDDDDSVNNYAVEYPDTCLNDDVIIITDDENTESSINELASSSNTRLAELNRMKLNVKATNTPKNFCSDEFYPTKYQEKVDKNNEIIKSLKRQLEIKKKEIIKNIDDVNELKKKKLENATTIALLKSEDMKIPGHIFSNLFNDDNNTVKMESMSEEVKTLTCKLYKCSPKAYDFIRKTFKNVFPNPEDIQKYCELNNIESNTIEIEEQKESKDLNSSDDEEEEIFLENE